MNNLTQEIVIINDKNAEIIKQGIQDIESSIKGIEILPSKKPVGIKAIPKRDYAGNAVEWNLTIEYEEDK